MPALRELDLLQRDFPDVHLVRGNVLMRLERGREAAEEFSTFLKQAPDDVRSEQIKQIVARVQSSSVGPIDGPNPVPRQDRF